MFRLLWLKWPKSVLLSPCHCLIRAQQLKLWLNTNKVSWGSLHALLTPLTHCHMCDILAVWLLRHIYNRVRCKQYGTIWCLPHLPERKRAQDCTCEWQHGLMERLLTGFFCNLGHQQCAATLGHVVPFSLRCSEYLCPVWSATQNFALKQKSAPTFLSNRCTRVKWLSVCTYMQRKSHSE